MASKNPVRINQIRAFNGINKRPTPNDGQMTASGNVSAWNYPALSPRKSRLRYGEYENASDCFVVDGSTYVVDGGALYKDGTKIADVQSGKKQWGLVNSKLVIWPDKIYVDLNNGNVVPVNVSLTGNAAVSGGTLTFGGTSTGGGSKAFRYYMSYPDGVRGEDSRRDLILNYRDLSWDGNKWNYTQARIDSPGTGMFFTGSQPELKYQEVIDGVEQQQVIISSFSPAVPNGIYSKITKVEEVSGEYNRIMYWETYGQSRDIANSFESGDTIEIEGCALFVNDGMHRVTDVKDNFMQIDGFIESAYYLDVQYPIAVGVVNVNGVKYQLARTILAGEQLYIPSGSSQLFCINKDTKKIDVFDRNSTQTQASQTIVMNSYNSATMQPLTIKRECPDMEYICAHNNRLFGVTNREESKVYNSVTGKVETVYSRVLHASELGYPTRWNSYNGNAMDSYSVAIGGSGDFTAICEYSNAVLVWKEDRMYKLSGDYPAEYILREYTIDGVKKGCDSSLCVINETAYYLSPAGIMAYSGGTPRLISYPLGMDYNVGATAGRDRTCYYICVTRAVGDTDFFVYDTVHGIWVQESTEHVASIARKGERALLCIEGKVYETDSGTEEVSWFADLAESDEGSFGKKNYLQFILDAVANAGSKISVSYRVDNDKGWTPLKTVTTDDGKRWQERYIIGDGTRHRYGYALPNLRCDRIAFRLEGIGPSMVYAAERMFQLDSERE